jgi:hypothetical protein
MASRNGRTAYDIVCDGKDRSVVVIGGNGTLGTSLPRDFVDEYGIEEGDSVVYFEADEEDDHDLELHLG